MRDDIIQEVFEAFAADVQREPSMSLRGGAAIDSYDLPPAFDATLDAPTDAYLEAHAFWAVPHLDAQSWRHYLPFLIAYALRGRAPPTSMATDCLVFSLRPPDRDPPRLGSLDARQEAVVVAFLEELAFNHGDQTYRDEALEALEEWWLPNARYRRLSSTDMQP